MQSNGIAKWRLLLTFLSSGSRWKLALWLRSWRRSPAYLSDEEASAGEKA